MTPHETLSNTIHPRKRVLLVPMAGRVPRAVRNLAVACLVALSVAGAAPSLSARPATPAQLVRQGDSRAGLATAADVASILAAIALVVAAIRFFMMLQAAQEAARATREAAQKVSQYAAWQLINITEGKERPGGRLSAVQDLAGQGISLAGVRLDGAWLKRARLASADLRSASLRGARLDSADLRGADLSEADLREASLSEANLQGASLASADLRGAILNSANLRGAFLNGANLRRADLQEADLRGADLEEADLREANLLAVQGWETIKNMRRAKIYGAVSAPDGFRTWALDPMGAIEGEPDATGSAT